MRSEGLQHKMYGLQGRSLAQRLLLASIGAMCVAIVWWLLLAGGVETAGTWIGRGWQLGDLVRRGILATVLSIYYIRILFTEFVFLKRGVSWSEVFTITPWILCIYLLLAISGGTNPDSIGLAVGIGILLFVAGSWMNSYAEYARDRWKRLAENRGKLYTQGLFRLSRHPNYLGDLISFSGMCLISGAWITVVIPILMLAGFVFVNIPMLDAHLQEHYGTAFDKYAAHTARLFPFLY